MDPLTEIFRALEAGGDVDTDELLPLVYGELRNLAGALLSKEMPGQTLQATALVHEAYVRLIRRSPGISNSKDSAVDGAVDMNWNSRAHFFGAAAEAMRRILIDNARKKRRLKHGGERQRVDLEPAELLVTAPPDDLIYLDKALTSLEQQDAGKAQIVKLRYFAGLSVEETAKTLKISTATVKRHWAFAKAWLRREMGKL